MRPIIKFFIEHPTIANLCVLLIVALGAMRLAQTQTTFYPTTKVRFVDVAVPYPGATPEQVEEGVLLKIEEELKGTVGIDRITSRASSNLGTVTAELTEEADADMVLGLVKNAVDRINTFPRGVESPVVEQREIKDLAVAFAVTGDVSLQTKKDLADQIELDLLATPGISDITLAGELEQEIEVAVRESALRTFELTFDDVARAVQSGNLETFGGEIKTGARNIIIKADDKGYFAKDLLNLVVSNGRNGEVVYLKDVASITDQFKDRAGKRYLGHEATLVINVYATPQQNVIENAEATLAYIAEFNKTHQGVALTVVEDGSEGVQESISTMTSNGIAGFVLVLLVLALFLDKYLAFWVALKIPVAIVGMFLLAGLNNLTINVVSLFAFVIVLGVLVDDGVVIGENILAWSKKKGITPKQAALEGTMEMVTPVLISLSTTAVAFAMFMFLPTQTGEFFGQIGFVVIAVLVVAAIESFFFLPSHLAHSKALRADNKPNRFEQFFNGSIDWVNERLYQPVFNLFVLGSKRKVLQETAPEKKPNMLWSALTVILFVVGLGASFGLSRGFTFFPSLDDKAVFIELDLPAGTPVEVTTKRLVEIQEAAYRANDKLRDTYKQDLIPFVEVITGPQPNQGRLKVTYVNSEKRDISSFELTEAIRAEAPPIPEALNLVYGIGASTAVFGKPVSIALRGSNLEDLRAARSELKTAMQAHPDLKDISDSDQSGVEEAIVRLTPTGERLGLTLAEVMNQVRGAFFGIEAQSLQRGNEEVEIWVRYPHDERTNEGQLMDMRIRTRSGGSYPLSELASLDYGTGNLVINRLEGQREIRIESGTSSPLVSAPAVIAELEAGVLSEIADTYPSVRYSVEGQNRDALKMGAGAGLVMPIILLLMFALIVIAFNSFSQAVLTFLLYPFALIGVMVGHWVHNTPLNVFSIIGTIALIGVFTNNSLVFITTYNQLLEQGKSFGESLSQAATSRFRPILLTTLTTVAGLAPLLASNSLSAQFLKGPAIAMAYGLSFGLFNTLLLLPAVLVLTNGGRRLLKRIKTLNKIKATPEQVEPAVRSQGNLMEPIITIGLLVLSTSVVAQDFTNSRGIQLSPKQVETSFEGPTLSLKQAVTEALANNPDLKVLNYDREVSRNNVNPAVAGMRPQIELRGGAFVGYADTKGETIPLGPPGAEGNAIDLNGERYGLQLTPEANWLVFDGGRGRARLEQLRLIDEAQAIGIEAAREGTIAGLTAAYLGGLKLARQRDLQAENITLTRALLQKSEGDELFGASTQLRSLQLQASLATDSAAYRTLTLELENVKRYINALMGRDTETDFSFDRPDLSMPRTIIYDSLYADLLASNEQLRAKRNEQVINAKAEELVASSFLPTLQLYGNVSYIDQVDNSNFLLNNRILGTEAGVRASYTLFDGGKRSIDRQNAVLTTAKSQASYEAQVASLTRELRQAFARRNDLIEQLVTERKNLPVFERAFQQTADAAGLGQASANQIREVQLQLLAARTRVAVKEVEVAEAEAVLLQITGGLVN